MKKIILRSKDKKEIIIEVSEVSSKYKFLDDISDYLDEARKYVQENLNREDRWFAYDYDTLKPIGNASDIKIYTATSWEGVECRLISREPNEIHYFYTREEALAKRKSYEAEAERLLDEKEKILKEIKVDLVLTGAELCDPFSDCRIAIKVEIEGYEFIRHIRNN